MPVIGVEPPKDWSNHRCKVPLGFFAKAWTVWQCPKDGKLWRFEPPEYEDMDSWTYHRYHPKENTQ